MLMVLLQALKAFRLSELTRNSSRDDKIVDDDLTKHVDISQQTILNKQLS